jgi:hypothetical protein
VADRPVLSTPVVALLAVALAAVLGWQVRHGGAPAPLRWEADGARFRLTADAARAAEVAVVPAPGALRFAPGTPPADQQAVLAAVAAARPEARRLVERVAGLVTVSVGAPARGVAGQMRTTPDGYEVQLDLASVRGRFGARGMARVTLHELAHVVDHALVTADLEAVLDAATPPGLGCDDGGLSGGCAVREERFAESFAKWATGDIGLNITLGYRVPPPDLAAWGRPLDALLG